ncbi:MAG: substrate-binding domain-containing protein [Actinomycetota bacterium]
MRRVTLCLLLFLATACTSTDKGTTLVLASTTSTQDSGLLDLLTRQFEADNPGTQVKTIAAGSGEVLALGKNKDADVLLMHSPEQETAFMKDGHGVSRQAVMNNEFIIVGPSSDPASASNGGTIQQALALIARSQQTFISRGDDSGTHRQEMQLWSAAGITPTGDWYLESGQGQAETLVVASEKSAYALTDSSTFAVTRSIDNLKALRLVGLRNPYSVIVVNDARNMAAAISFADWLTNSKGQLVIARQGLFTPVTPAGP